jgi:hypothetical protein
VAFTYTIDSADAAVAARSLIRRAIGDTVEDAGPLPDGVNFSDEELDAIGEAGALRALAAAWAVKADTQAGPLRKSFSQISARYATLAAAAAGGAAASGEASLTFVPVTYRDTSANDEFSR